MNVRLPVLLAVLSIGIACAHHHHTVLPPAVPYSLRADVADSSKLQSPANVAVQVLDIPRLSTATLPPGARELRISDWWGMMLGSSLTILRLVEIPGQPPVGQLIAVWPQLKERPGGRPDRCTDWKDGKRNCVRLLDTSDLDWAAVARHLDELGAWTVVTACEGNNSGYYTDSGELFLERLVGERFDLYTCNAPYNRHTSEARIASGLLSYADSLARMADGNR